MRFLHIADVHLGNHQYNLPKRFDDFGRAFLDAVGLAIDKQVTACVIAGDLFHKATVEPMTLLQAEEGLSRLREAGIEAIAVNGNHDKARYRDQVSWLDYLADRKLVHLLTPDFAAEPLRLEAGYSYVDVEGVRFLGVPWLGAAAARVLAEVAEVLEKLDWHGIRFTVLVTHAGVEGQMPHMSGVLTFAELAPLRRRVNYLALGHLHKPYALENWIYNPGSLETCSFEEIQYERGVYLVTVDSDGAHTAEHIRTVMRPFFSLPFATDQYRTPEDLLEGLRGYVRREKQAITQLVRSHPDPVRALPVVRLVLQGHLSFDRARLDMEAMRRLLRDEIEALLVRVENRTRPLGTELTLEEGLDRAELERRVFADLAHSDSRYSAQADAWSRLMQQVMTLALESATPEAIFAELDRHMQELEEAEHVDH